MLVFGDRDELVDLYVAQGLSAREIAKRKYCSQSTVINALDKYEIPKRPRGGSKLGANTICTQELLEEFAYFRNVCGLTFKKCAEYMNVSESTLRAWRDKHGI